MPIVDINDDFIDDDKAIKPYQMTRLQGLFQRESNQLREASL